METHLIAYLGADDQTFYLPIARWIAAEKEAGCSLFQVYYWLGEHLGKVAAEFILTGPCPATLSQCQAVIRNALVGGGMEEKAARDLVQTYCAPARPAIRDMALAWEVLNEVIYGVDLKKNEEAPEEGEAEPPNHSAEEP